MITHNADAPKRYGVVPRDVEAAIKVANPEEAVCVCNGPHKV
jgi:hypothetical protein